MMRFIVTVACVLAFWVIPVLAVSITDDFNRSDGGLGANWTETDNTCTVVSNAAGDSDAGNCMSAYTAVAFGNNQCSQVTISAGLASGSNYAGVSVRNSTDTGANRDNYHFTTDGVSGAAHSILREVVNGTPATLQNVVVTYANGDIVKLCVVGTDLTVYKNGAVVTTVSDNTIASGYPGITVFGTSIRMDDWIGTDGSRSLLLGVF